MCASDRSPRNDGTRNGFHLRFVRLSTTSEQEGPVPEIKTPSNMPRIAKVIKFWPYRYFFDRKERDERPTVQLYRKKFSRHEDRNGYEELETLRLQLAAVTSPERPDHHIDNHSGWEVELVNGTTAFVLYSDFNVTVYSFPPVTHGCACSRVSCGRAECVAASKT